MREPIRVWPGKKKLKPETLILRDVKKYLEINRWWIVRFQGGLGTYPGLPDLCAMKKGRFVWIEIKTPTGKLSEAQVAFQARCLEEGMEFYVIKSVDEAIDLFP